MRTWAEIDLDHLAHNYHKLRELVPPKCRFLGLCKANGYGHGAVDMGRMLEKLGADMLAVACLNEAMELRRGGIKIPILCLGQIDPYYAPLLVEHDVTATVGDWETGWALSKYAQGVGKTIKIHVKLDTGMTRLGFLWGDGDNQETLEQMVALCDMPNLKAEGIFTHFADSDGNRDYTMNQLERFLEAKGTLARRGRKFAIYHSANSGGTLHYPSTHLNMIRPGIALYGYYPDEGAGKGLGWRLRPVMSLKSRIVAVRDIPAGTPVSYGCTTTLERDSRIAVLPVGYGDGLHRNLSNLMSVDIGGESCPQVGRICMDMCMIDVTDHPEIGVGDVATIFGNEGQLDLLAELGGTIPYEMLCNISPRVPRVYHGGAVPHIE